MGEEFYNINSYYDLGDNYFHIIFREINEILLTPKEARTYLVTYYRMYVRRRYSRVSNIRLGNISHRVDTFQKINKCTGPNKCTG